jgi:hypothetical protein
MANIEIRHFDDPLPIDRVAFAIAPIDSFTGAIVRGPVTAEIRTLGVRARRNLSGMLVFINLTEQDKYQVEIKAEVAGFFDVTREVTRPPNDASDIARLTSVQLHPLPTAPFTSETTLVRGVVQRDGEPLERAAIGAVVAKPEPDPGPQPDDALTFETLSDRRGAFVLPLRLPNQTPGQTGIPTASFWFRFRKTGLPELTMKRQVTDGSEHRFGMPIDLADDGSQVNPVLVPSGI